jgi:hypothetical protein
MGLYREILECQNKAVPELKIKTPNSLPFKLECDEASQVLKVTHDTEALRA